MADCYCRSAIQAQQTRDLAASVDSLLIPSLNSIRMQLAQKSLAASLDTFSNRLASCTLALQRMCTAQQQAGAKSLSPLQIEPQSRDEPAARMDCIESSACWRLPWMTPWDRPSVNRGTAGLQRAQR